ncbi:MAG TPA: SGNH/GDSL hydrolase family protein [Cyclobacteriaceae bacterium]
MKKWFLYAFALLVLISCEEDEDSTAQNDNDSLSDSQLAVLTLGDSRVDGASPDYESYRYELWKNMVLAGYEVNMIGPFDDEWSHPEFMGMTFDDDHAGIGGNTTEQVIGRLDQALNSANRPPDIVILGIGGNDLLQGATISPTIANINTIIDGIQADNPEVTIFLEQISGARSDTEEAFLNSLLQDFANEIEAVANNQTNSDSEVIPVDMYNNIPDSYFADAVHFNETGAKAVADRYFAAIDAYLKE